MFSLCLLINKPLYGDFKDYDKAKLNVIYWHYYIGISWDNYRLPNLEDWRQSGKGAPADYIINWLAGWVEYFGIDGFRCDTAKNVELSRWNQCYILKILI